MANIFSLYGSIFVDNEKANKSIDETTNKGKEQSKTFGEKFGEVAKTVGTVATTVVGLGVTYATAMLGMANSTAKHADNIDKMSQRLGMTKQTYQEWDYILGQNGVSIESMNTAMKSMTASMDSLAKEGTKGTETLGKLGISVDDLKNKSQEDIFEQAVRSLQQMPEGYEKARMAQQLFGKQGQEMLPLLNTSKGSMDELKQKAHELGLIMGDDAVASGVKFSDTMDSIKRAMGMAFAQLGSAVMPLLQKLLDLIVKNMPFIQSMFDKLAPVLASILEGLLPPLVELAQMLLPQLMGLMTSMLPFIMNLVNSVMPIITKMLTMLLPPLMQIVEALLPVLIALIEPLLPLLEPILMLLQPFIDLLLALLMPILDLIKIALPPLIEFLVILINVALVPLQKALEITSRILSNVFANAFENIKPVIEGFKRYFTGLIQFITGVFTGDWKKAWEGIKNIFGGIFDAFIGMVKFPFNQIIGMINIFIKGLNKIKIPDWVPGVGGKGINLPEFKKLRIGMPDVPYDDFPALLHKGERVLTASENKEYSKPQEKQMITNFNNTIQIEKLEVREDKDIERIAEELYYLQKRELVA